MFGRWLAAAALLATALAGPVTAQVLNSAASYRSLSGHDATVIGVPTRYAIGGLGRPVLLVDGFPETGAQSGHFAAFEQPTIFIDDGRAGLPVVHQFSPSS